VSEFDPIVVQVDPEIADLVPGYLERRRGDVDSIGQATDAGNFEEARRLSHSMRGTGGSYGFPRLSELGTLMETAAKASDGDELRKHLAQVKDYLARIQLSSS
jgi:HPt (histidine-containing phosphotransfer) domain-containing protein